MYVCVIYDEDYRVYYECHWAFLTICLFNLEHGTLSKSLLILLISWRLPWLKQKKYITPGLEKC